MKLKLSMIIPTIMLLLISCNKQDITDPSSPGCGESPGIIPLKVGNTWLYKTYQLNEDGSVNSELYERGIKITDCFEKEYNNNKIIIYQAADCSITDGSINIENYLNPYWYSDSFGLHQMGTCPEGNIVILKYVHYIYPVNMGRSWSFLDFSYFPVEKEYGFMEPTLITCTDTAAVFETPIGTFQCYVFYHRSSQGDDVSEVLDYYEYFVPNLGKVGEIIKGYIEFPDGTIENYYKWKKVLYYTNVEY